MRAAAILSDKLCDNLLAQACERGGTRDKRVLVVQHLLLEPRERVCLLGVRARALVRAVEVEALDPAKLVGGLAATSERLEGVVFEAHAHGEAVLENGFAGGKLVL